MDRQHEKLLLILQRCSEISAENGAASLDSYTKALNDLNSYASMHFYAEESLLESVSYPAVAQQRLEHMNFRRTMEELILLSESGDLRSKQLMDWLNAWWFEHILQSDMQYKPFVRT